MKMNGSLLFAILLVSWCVPVIAQSSFPRPDAVLYDAKHKEPKSGVELRGNEITIRSGVGTPSTINVLAFSRDGTFLVAGKDYGRVVIWQVANGSFLRAIDTGQGIVNAVAVSPDDQLIATAGQEDQRILIWNVSDGRLVRSLKIGNPPVHALAFGLNSATLVGSENGAPTFVFDATSGNSVEMFPEEWSPVLSVDGKALMTVLKNEVIVRDTRTWKKQAEIPRPTKSAFPLALNENSDAYVYGDSADNHSFISVRISTGELFPNQKFGKLPQWNPSEGGFAAFDPQSGLVFGHSGGRLWVWNIQDGKTCMSPVLYSESGALSSDGSMLAGGLDNSIFATDKVKPGVVFWHTSSIRKACGMQAQ
jgi:WD40 repeat protein